MEAMDGVDPSVTVSVSTLKAKTMPKASSAMKVCMLDCIKIFLRPILSTRNIPTRVPNTCVQQSLTQKRNATSTSYSTPLPIYFIPKLSKDYPRDQ